MEASQVLEELSVPDRMPVEAIRAARADRVTLAPVFLRAIEDFLSPSGTPVAPNALFFIFHLLGEWREKSAYRPLAAFLRLPRQALDPILGDSITVTAHRVMAAVFDGDPDPLYEIIRDQDADEFVRSGMCHTLATLARSGDLPRTAVMEFLRDCFSKLQPRDYCYVWHGWLDAIAWLGLAELKSLVEQAYEFGYADPSVVRLREFEQDLQHAVENPDAALRFPGGDLTLFGDTIEEMSDWDGFKPKGPGEAKPGWNQSSSLRMPLGEPSRKVGRNEPCPCGSGKKYKKCCLNSAITAVG
jgi:hypothetical protein